MTDLPLKGVIDSVQQLFWNPSKLPFYPQRGKQQ